MKEYKNIDELFREGLKDLEVTPSPKVWEGIRSSVSFKPDPGLSPLIKWLSVIVVSLFVAGTIYYFSGSENHPLSHELNQSSKETTIATTSSNTNSTIQTDVNTSKPAAESSMPEPSITEKGNKTPLKTPNEKANLTVTKVDNQKTEVRVVNKTTNSKQNDIFSKQTLTKAETKNSKELVSTLSKENSSNATKASTAPTKVIHIKKNQITRPDQKEINAIVAARHQRTNKNINSSFHGNDATLKVPFTKATEQKQSDVTTLDSKNITVNAPQTGILYPEDQTVIHNIEQVSKAKKHLHAYTGVNMGVGVICYSGNQEKQLTWSAEGVAGMNLKKFYFETGAGFRYMQQTGNYQIDYQTFDSIGYYNEVTSFEVDPADQDNIILHYQQTTVYDSIKHVVYTSPEFSYRYLVIPVKIGYSFWNNKRVFMAGEMGIEYNRLMKEINPGTDFEAPGDVTNIINNTEVRNSNTWKIGLGIRIGYRFNNNILFIIQPGYSHYLNSIYDTQKGYSDVKPCIMNLKGGILIDF